MSLPKNMKALKCLGKGKSGVVEVPLPASRPDYILVKVSYVALNPTDWKHIDFMPHDGATVGCDYSGTVVSVGPDVKKGFKPGDRIAGFTHGVNAVQPEDGCFAEYCVAKGDIQMAVPQELSDSEAATLGAAINTIAQSLYEKLGLPLPTAPTSDKTPILIYGASSTTGLAACQFAKLSGFSPVATCSPRNAELVKSYGADAVFDYSDPDACAAQIRKHTGDSLMYALDCISEKTTAKICADALSSKGGGSYCSLLPVEAPRTDVKSLYVLAYTVTGEAFTFRAGKEFPAEPERFNYAVKFWQLADQLLKEGKIKAPPLDERKGGLEGIQEGLDDFRQGRVSGRKLVYQL